jgi:DNA-binding NarL/FixJ family response regulator
MRILFADDHALIRESLKPYLLKLSDDCEIVEVGSLDEALAKTKETWDLVLLDLQMPGVEGFDGFDTIKKTMNGTPIVILSGYSDKRTINAALDRGAAGFIPKSATGKTLVRALQTVLDGERFIPSSILEESDAPSIFDRGKKTGPAADSPLNRLTDREAEVLRLLIAGKTNKEIAITLGLQEITVKIHLRNSYKKIGAGNRADAVRIAYESGWQTTA